MSEYQYYEFRTIDRPLTGDQQADVAAISSRAHVTSHTASFVYNYGDFRGSVQELMTDYFDAMLYMANWGSRRLIFRIPCALVDLEKFDRYCISREITINETKDHKNVIIDLNFYDEDQVQGEWIEGEGWLDDLADLRSELIRGDFRALYLAWLKAAEYGLRIEKIDGNTLEPPVPAGLDNLSAAQETFVEFLDIDEDMIAAAAQKSNKRPKAVNLEPWIDRLTPAEQHDFLVRLSRGETNLPLLFNRRLGELANEAQPREKEAKTQHRTISALIEASDTERQKRKEDERRKAELARQRELEALVPEKHQLWKEVERLIEEKKIKSYEEAIKLLIKLNELAQYQRDQEEFKNRIVRLGQTYSNRPAFLKRLEDAKII